MALKFLNKKGWHTGSLRNIENVWKAEQKHDAEQKKLEELRKQIQEERERNEFRLLQQQAGLVPSQERLDFLYDSGLAVGKGSSDGFNALEAIPKTQTEPSSSKQEPVPGALFEDKPQSANDAWRKLHSDPLLLIRQREQEALARIKNNPVQMARIHKSVEEKKKHKEEKHRKKEHKKHHKKSKPEKHSSKYLSDSEEATSGGEEERSKRSGQVSEHHKKSKHSSSGQFDSEGATSEVEEERSKRSRHVDDHPRRSKHSSKGHSDFSGVGSEGGEERSKRSHADGRHRNAAYESENGHARTDVSTVRHGLQNKRSRTAPKLLAEEKAAPAREMQLDAELHEVEEERSKRSRHVDDHPMRSKHSSKGHSDFSGVGSEGEEERSKRSHADGRRRTAAYESENSHARTDVPTVRHGLQNKRSQTAPKLSAEEKAARAREMQLDAELHEEQRWKRLKKASEADVQEANQAKTSSSKNFLDAAQKSVYGTEKGGSSTIEESVRRRTYYLQGKSDREGNAFRR
ncbi:uncharacterized protein LOC131257670 isoform X2 [Magnolia sinica]|uniref:uncharacterized protein LOC131257670 isoform X2 n=1 Tax=Magnolia sinica TaxID=86752 RepID=UPI00265847CD|nr:uncharacterized protein LOC131257670 isoform X2 [Magnolia sinica]